MDKYQTESRLEEIARFKEGEREDFEYYRYELSRPVICTINFRDSLTQKVQSARIAPIKIGEGNKFTQEGVMKVPRGFDPFIRPRFRQATIEYTETTEIHFNEVTQQARIKVFFRGFPHGTHVEEVKLFFSTFGKIEYLYVMTPSKARGQSPVMQGYFIFGSNEESLYFLENRPPLYFGWSLIHVEIYQGAKKKRNFNGKRSTNQGSAFVDTQGLISSGDQGCITLKDSYHSKTSGQGCLAHGKSNPVQASNPTVLLGQVIQVRPYMVNLGFVKLNSTEQANLRFNLRLKHQLV